MTVIATADASGASLVTVLLLVACVVLIVAVLAVAGLAMRSRGATPATPEPETVDAPLSMTLRFLAEDRASAALVVNAPHGEAHIFMRNGVVFHAESAGTVGDRAVSEALRWDSSVTRVTVRRDVPLPDAHTVSMGLADLLRGAGVRN